MKTNKFEQLVEYIINEDESKAKALFHQIVVEKSRDIYESLEEESRFPIQQGRGAEALANEIEDHSDGIDGDEEGMHEDEDEFGGDELGGDELGDEEGEFSDDDAALGGDEEFGGDEEGLGGVEGEHEEIEDRVMDLEDAIDELKAEFDQLMAGEEHEEGEFPGIHGDGNPDTDMADELDSEEGEGELEGEPEGEEEVKEESASVYEAKKETKGKKPEFLEKAEKKAEEKEGKDVKEARKSPADLMREYVEKVTIPSNKSESGDLVGTGAESQKPTVNKKSTNIGGKNDMGGTTANIARGGSEAAPDGTSPKKASNAYTKGETQVPHAGNFENVPGAKAGKAFSKAKKPATKEGSPAGAKNTDPSNTNDKSTGQPTGGKPGFKG